MSDWSGKTSPRTPRLLATIAYVVFACALPWLLRAGFGAESLPEALNIAILCGIGAIAALGLNIIVGYCGLLNLGFAGFMLIGAYTAGILMKQFGWSFWLAAPAAMLHGALWGILLGLPTLRLVGDYFAIVTFGFSELVIMIAKNWVAITRGPRGYPDIPRPSLDFSWLAPVLGTDPKRLVYQFSIIDRAGYWYLVAALLGITLFVSSRLVRSRLGRAWLAIREDEVAAEACGINAMWFKTQAFALSAAFGALAGATQAAYFTLADYRNYEFMTSVYVLCYVVLGGMGTVIGPVVGATVLVALAELLRKSPAVYLSPLFAWWPKAEQALLSLPWVPDMRLILYGVILILMIRFRPEGIFPSRSRARELHHQYAPGEEDGLSFYYLHMR